MKCKLCEERDEFTKGLCQKCYNSQYFQTNKVKVRTKQKEYYQENKDEVRKTKKKWFKNNPDKSRLYYLNNIKKYKARRLAKKISIPKGQICEKCGKKLAIERHHEDYNKPLDVMFVCKDCNMIYYDRNKLLQENLVLKKKIEEQRRK